MDVFSSLENKLKLGTAILGVFSVGLHAGSYSFYGWREAADEYALAIVILALIFSFFLLAAMLLNAIPQTVLWRKIEICVHVLFTVLLAIGWLCFVINTAKLKGRTAGWKATRSFALIFGGINIGLYGFVSVLLFQQTQAT